MKATRQLHDLGQSLWLDNMTRGILNEGTLQRYMSELSVAGLTSNPTIFHHAIKHGDVYDDAIRRKAAEGKSGETLFFEPAIDDLVCAADLFGAVHDRTGSVDGWVSIEVSPLLAKDTAGTIRAAVQLHGRARCRNLFIKIPGTFEGVSAIEDLDGGDAKAVLAELRRAGVDDTALAARLQREGTAPFDTSWKDLLECLAAKSAMLAQRDRATAGTP